MYSRYDFEFSSRWCRWSMAEEISTYVDIRRTLDVYFIDFAVNIDRIAVNIDRIADRRRFGYDETSISAKEDFCHIDIDRITIDIDHNSIDIYSSAIDIYSSAIHIDRFADRCRFGNDQKAISPISESEENSRTNTIGGRLRKYFRRYSFVESPIDFRVGNTIDRTRSIDENDRRYNIGAIRIIDFG